MIRIERVRVPAYRVVGSRAAFKTKQAAFGYAARSAIARKYGESEWNRPERKGPWGWGSYWRHLQRRLVRWLLWRDRSELPRRPPGKA